MSQQTCVKEVGDPLLFEEQTGQRGLAKGRCKLPVFPGSHRSGTCHSIFKSKNFPALPALLMGGS